MTKNEVKEIMEEKEWLEALSGHEFWLSYNESISCGNYDYMYEVWEGKKLHLRNVEFGSGTAFTLIYRNVSFAVLEDVDASYSICIKSKMRHAILNNVKVVASRWDNTDFTGSTFIDVDFFGASLIGCDFSHTTFVGVNFTEAILRGAKFDGAKFINCTFDGAVDVENTSFINIKVDYDTVVKSDSLVDAGFINRYEYIE